MIPEKERHDVFVSFMIDAFSEADIIGVPTMFKKFFGLSFKQKIGNAMEKYWIFKSKKNKEPIEEYIKETEIDIIRG